MDASPSSRQIASSSTPTPAAVALSALPVTSSPSPCFHADRHQAHNAQTPNLTFSSDSIFSSPTLASPYATAFNRSTAQNAQRSKHVTTTTTTMVPTAMATSSSPMSVLSDVLLYNVQQTPSTTTTTNAEVEMEMEMHVDLSSPLFRRSQRPTMPTTTANVVVANSNKENMHPGGMMEGLETDGESNSKGNKLLWPSSTSAAAAASTTGNTMLPPRRDRRRSNSNPMMMVQQKISEGGRLLESSKMIDRRGLDVKPFLPLPPLGQRREVANTSSSSSASTSSLAPLRYLESSSPRIPSSSTANAEEPPNRATAAAEDLREMEELCAEQKEEEEQLDNVFETSSSSTPLTPFALARKRKWTTITVPEIEREKELSLDATLSHSETSQDEGRVLRLGSPSVTQRSSGESNVDIEDIATTHVKAAVAQTIVTLPARDDVTYEGSRRQQNAGTRDRSWLAGIGRRTGRSQASWRPNDVLQRRRASAAKPATTKKQLEVETPSDAIKEDSAIPVASVRNSSLPAAAANGNASERHPRSYLETFTSRPALDSHMIVTNPNHANPRRRDWSPAYAAAYSNASRCSSDGGSQILALGTESGAVKVIDTRAQAADEITRTTHYFTPHANAIFDVAWSRSDTRLLTASADHSSTIFDTKRFATLATLRGHFGSVKTSAWMDDNIVATAGREGNVHIYDLRTRGDLAYGRSDWAGKPKSKRARPEGIDDGSLFPVLSIRNAHGPGARGKPAAASAVRSVTSLLALESRPHTLASGGSGDGVVRLWDLRALGDPRRAFVSEPIGQTCDRTYDGDRRSRGIMSLVEGRGEIFALTGSSRIEAHSITSPEGHLATSYIHPNLRVSSFYVKLAMSPCKQYLASGSTSGSAFLWEIGKTGFRREVMGIELGWQAHPRELGAIAWGGDNELATCSDDYTTRIWRSSREGYQAVMVGDKTWSGLRV